MSYLFITPVSNLIIEKYYRKELTIGRVILVRRERLPYIRRRLGLQHPFGSMKMLKKMKLNYLKKADVYACMHISGNPTDMEYDCIKQVRDALHVLTVSELGYSKRRFTSVPNVWGVVDLGSFEYMFVDKANPNALPGWTRYGTFQPMRIDRNWTRYHSSMFFLQLLKVLNRDTRASPGWRETLWNAAVLIGKSVASKDVGYAFLQNMIAIEMLLTQQGDKYTDVLPERIESFLGWVGYWQTDDYEQRIRRLYRLRCSVVHDGRYDWVTVEDLLFADDVVFNLMNNIIHHIRLFRSKQSLIDFARKVQAEHVLGINARVRPDTLVFVRRTYSEEDLKQII